MSSAILSACSSLPEQTINGAFDHKIDKQIAKYQVVKTDAFVNNQPWWQQIDNAELNQYISQMLQQNQNLKASAARIRAAVAQLSDQQKANWPQGSLGVSANRDKGVTTGTSQIAENINAGASLTWQLDLSGRLSALAAAAEASAQNSQAMHQTLVTELVSNSVRSYLYWQNLQQQKTLTERQLSALESSIEILNARYAEGLSTELELNRTQAQYFELKQRLPQIAAESAKVEAVLATLQNSQPSQLVLTPLSSEQYQELSFNIEITSPIEALMNRGDMQSARAKLLQNQHLAVSAERALYPDISFAAFAGIFNSQGVNLSDSSSSWQFAPQLSWSLFSYPQLLAQLEAQQALSEASYYDYQNQVTEVIANTELSLQLLVQLEQQVSFAKQRSLAASKAYNLANSGYQEGQLGYLELLNARQDVLIAEQAQLVVHNQWLEANVNVYNAFNGQWSSALLASI